MSTIFKADGPDVRAVLLDQWYDTPEGVTFAPWFAANGGWACQFTTDEGVRMVTSVTALRAVKLQR